jgi:3-methyl-2-oxobutanoate hydroxymethyltransferase
MSTSNSIKRITVPDILDMKTRGEKIVSLTAYDYIMAQLLDESGIDIILVGDSAGMVFSGYESTLPVTMEMMLYHVAAVRRGTKRALLVADMPFMSYQAGWQDAVKNAGRFLQESGAEAVKLEGGSVIAESISKLTGLGIPVMGHLGLTPQSINKFGSYRLVGLEKNEEKNLIEDARILEEAGVFSIVLEKVPADLAGKITDQLKIPTIGIGAGNKCDGQVLVSYDMLGLYEKFQPKFVRRYAEIASHMRTAFENFTKDVKSGHFPAADESY